jgi:hypothetical protein
MSKKILIIIIFLSLQLIYAGVSEKNIHRSPLNIYSGGVSIGVLKSLSEELNDKSSQYIKVSFNNMIYFRKQLSLFFDVDWFGLGHNYGSDFGFTYFFTNTDFRPYGGLGVGAHYFHRKGADFGECFGPSAKVQFGLLFDVAETFQIKMQIPYHVVINEYVDQGIGVEIGFMFSGRNRAVKKLNYNRKSNYEPKSDDE